MKHKPLQALFVFITLLALTFGAVGIMPASAATADLVPLAATMTPDDSSVLDLLVVWTPTAETSIGGVAKMAQWIDGMVLRTNMAFRNSDVNTRLVLVHKQQVTYTESVSLTDLTALKDGTGGLDVVHALRDTYHADMVLMVRQGSGSEGGQAYQLTNVSTASSKFAYGVVRTVSDRIFPHELGHMLGASHDWYVDGMGNAPYPYAHGWTSPVKDSIDLTLFRDIMGGGGGAFAPGTLYDVLAYSNPDLTYRGAPLGLAAGTKSDCVAGNASQVGLCDADLRTTFNNTAPIAAQFRSSEARWTGAVSTDWNTAGNWEFTSGNPASPTMVNRVPRAIDNVLIPAGLSNYPAISGSAAARDVKIASGASLTMSGSGTLTVSGKWQADGTFTASGGTVVFNSALDKPMTLQMSGGSYFNHLQIGDGTAMPWIQLGSALAVHGNLTLNVGSLFQHQDNTITLTGNWQDNGAGFDYASSNVVFNGSGQTANAVSSAVILNQDFSYVDWSAGTLKPNEPYGWANALGTIGNPASYWWFGDTGSGKRAVRDWKQINANTGVDAWLFTQAVNLSAGVNYRLKFDYSVENGSDPSDFSAWYGSHLLPSQMQTAIVTVSNATNTTMNTANQNFSVSASSAYNLGLRNYDNAAQLYEAYMDNIILTIEPSIPAGFGTSTPTYTVTFDANGGTGAMAPQTSSIPAALNANTFTRSGYTFSGWNTAANGTGMAYADGATYDFSANITLYAQWTANALASNWHLVTSPTNNWLDDVSITPASNGMDGWAVGYDGTFIHWDGTNWNTVAGPTGDFLAVAMVDANEGWATNHIESNQGKIYRWDGTSWSEATSLIAFQESLSVVPGSNGQDIWSAGWWGEIYRWDGSDWNQANTTNLLMLYGVDSINASDAWAVGGMHGQPEATGILLHWDGANWVNNVSPETGHWYNAVEMVASNDVWAVGNSGTIIHWNGTTWSQVSSPTTNDLYGISMVPGSNGTKGWAVGANGTILFWNGNTWIVTSSPTTKYLMSVEMVSDTDGWVVGEDGTILRFIPSASPADFGKTAPANGATNQSLFPTLSWQSSTGANSYQYCIDTTNDNTCVSWVSTGTNTSVGLSGLEANTTYYWQVRANDAGGTTYANGAATTFWLFTTGEATATFPDVPTDLWAWAFIERLYNAGLTGGYPDGTYRPDNTVTRAEMAIFLMKGMNGPAYSPPAVSPTFSDTSGHWAANWIEALKAAGLTGGYPDGTYRPNNPVTRAEMAIFLLKAMNGAAYTPPAASPTFSDTADHWAANWIEALKAAGITSGYPDGTYRPGNYVTRAEMAVFLVKAFGLP